MIASEIRQHLFELADNKYRDFQSSLTPTVSSRDFIGVRTPALRAYAKELVKRDDIGEFLADLPHKSFDENQLHAFIISLYKDFDSCIAKVEAFLPYVDNWATCDQMSPKVFAKHKKELLKHIKLWLDSDKTYTVRFGIKMLMEHFLDVDFDLKYPKAVAEIRSDEYYIKMMQAWYFATALAKQYGSVIGFIRDKKLDDWTHNKAIQKSVESYRINDEQKQYLRTLKIKGKVKDR
ncbi:DNA alkylation repair protein [Ruminococcus sp. FC2018]|uniref:DNA alkylation repair protein n=1 Tax=Ruminococcus sp. FC2018 TaxID=1410617 RepID=UPI00048B163A|nr:DNA alkylation repair protein [Ruminococcus sp. FC2018]